jgi:hypothetical protein
VVWDPLLIRWLDGNEMGVQYLPLWNLCDYFAPLCVFVIIFKYNLIGVVLTYNSNFRKLELINLESSVSAFLLRVLYLIYLVITFIFHLFTTLAEYQQ